MPPPDGAVVRGAADPFRATGGLVVRTGNLAPDGALIKIAGLTRLAIEGTGGSPAAPAACASATSRPRPPTVGRSLWSTTATSSGSTPLLAPWS